MSKNKKVRLRDSEDNEHTIIFYRGKAVEVICPELGKCVFSDWDG